MILGSRLLHELRFSQSACSLLTAGAAAFLPPLSSVTVRSMSFQGANSLYDSQQFHQIVRARKQLVAGSPVHLLRIKGVSFDNRQELVQQLVPGQPVMFSKEPSNPHDPLAVQIATLDGAELGWTSRHVKRAFPLPVCFGTVVSMGQVTTADDTGKWGALVACSPALHGLSLDLLPQQDWHGAQLHHGNSLELCQRILGSKYDAQRLSALQRYSHRCAITGISKSAMPLQVVPQWVFNRHKRPNKCVELFGPHHAVDWEGDSHGLMAICEPLARVKQAADNGLSTASREDLQAVISMLMAVNSWAQQDAETYIQFAEQRRQELQLDNWACAAA